MRTSVKPPVEAPTSRQTRPPGSSAKASSAAASLIPPRDAQGCAASASIGASPATSAEAFLSATPPTLTSPAVIAFRYPSTPRVLLRIVDAHLHVLARRVVSADCIGACPAGVEFSNHVHFSVAGLQPGYVVISPVHVNPATGGQVVEIPVTLNGG